MYSRASTPSESSPLLPSSRTRLANDGSDQPSSASPDPGGLRVSRTDLIWILAGLWSAVFLGALDGKSCPVAQLLSQQ